MATATITLKKGTTAEWTESKRVLDDGELGLETTTSGHRIIRIGNGSTEFMSLPVAFDIEEVREIKTGMDKDAKTYYDDMVKKGNGVACRNESTGNDCRTGGRCDTNQVSNGYLKRYVVF